MLTDPIADMLTRLRNANMALHDTAVMPHSRMKESLAGVLEAVDMVRAGDLVAPPNKRERLRFTK